MFYQGQRYLQSEFSVWVFVKKVWLDSEGNEFTPTQGNIQVELIRHESSDVEVYGHTVTIKVKNREWTPGSTDKKEYWEEIPYQVADGGKLDFTVLNYSGQKVTTLKVSDGNTYTITNNNTTPQTITIGPVTQDLTVEVIRTEDNWTISNGNYSVAYDEAGTGFKENSGTVKDKVTLNYNSDTAKSWKYSWSDLPKQDDKSGNPLYYEVKEVGNTEGYTISYNHNGISSGTVTITNREKPTKDFTFTKKWVGKNNVVVNSWPSGRKIEVTLKGTNDSDASKTVTYTFEVNNGEPTRTDNLDGNISISKTGDDKAFIYLIENLPDGYTYTLTETKVDGYKGPEYLDANGYSKIDQTKGASDGEMIKNVEESAYELPSTGSTGIERYLGIGAALMSAALVLAYILTYIERRRE